MVRFDQMRYFYLSAIAIFIVLDQFDTFTEIYIILCLVLCPRTTSKYSFLLCVQGVIDGFEEGFLFFEDTFALLRRDVLRLDMRGSRMLKVFGNTGGG